MGFCGHRLDGIANIQGAGEMDAEKLFSFCSIFPECRSRSGSRIKMLFGGLLAYERLHCWQESTQ
eukprot:5553751-Amphidinium_carterae.1